MQPLKYFHSSNHNCTLTHCEFVQNKNKNRENRIITIIHTK